MRMVKADDRDPQRLAGGDGLPRHLVGIAGLDDVGLSPAPGCAPRPPAAAGRGSGRCARPAGSGSCKSGRALLRHDLIASPGDDEDVASSGGVLMEVGDLLLQVTFHAAADGASKTA